jgi:hypothetical protein
MRKPRHFAHRPIYYEERLTDNLPAKGSATNVIPTARALFSVKDRRKGKSAAVSIPLLLSMLLIILATALLIVYS